MARTRQDWYDYMINQKATHQELDDLNTASNTAIWLKILWVVSYAAWLLESVFEQFKKDIVTIADAGKVGVAKWYKRESLKFQLGDQLVWSDELLKYHYPVIEPDHQIVKQAAVVFSGGEVRIKVAKSNGTTLEPLDATEKLAFEEYWKLNKVAGTTLSVISLAADDLLFDIDIIYNPLLLRSDGALISDSSVFPVTDAINDYLINLPFDGRLWENQLEDVIQSAQGVVSVTINSLQVRNGTALFESFTKFYDTISGHLVIDSGSTINYTNV